MCTVTVLPWRDEQALGIYGRKNHPERWARGRHQGLMVLIAIHRLEAGVIHPRGLARGRLN